MANISSNHVGRKMTNKNFKILDLKASLKPDNPKLSILT